VLAIVTAGCATGVSTVAASTARTATNYRSASSHVRLGTDEVFDSAVGLLLERDDIEVDGVDEASRRCSAVAGDRRLTLRVIDDGVGGSRLSVTVGRGDDTDANQALAELLVREICERFGDACDPAADPPSPHHPGESGTRR